MRGFSEDAEGTIVRLGILAVRSKGEGMRYSGQGSTSRELVYSNEPTSNARTMSVNTFTGRTILAKVAANVRSLAPLCVSVVLIDYNGFADAESLPPESKVSCLGRSRK